MSRSLTLQFTRSAPDQRLQLVARGISAIPASPLLRTGLPAFRGIDPFETHLAAADVETIAVDEARDPRDLLRSGPIILFLIQMPIADERGQNGDQKRRNQAGQTAFCVLSHALHITRFQPHADVKH